MEAEKRTQSFAEGRGEVAQVWREKEAGLGGGVCSREELFGNSLCQVLCF